MPLTRRELQYLRFLISRDPKDLPGFITEKTLFRLIKAGAIEYVPVSAPSPLRGRWVATERGRSIALPT